MDHENRAETMSQAFANHNCTVLHFLSCSSLLIIVESLSQFSFLLGKLRDDLIFVELWAWIDLIPGNIQKSDLRQLTLHK